MGRPRIHPPCARAGGPRGGHDGTFYSGGRCICGYARPERLRGTSNFDTRSRRGRWEAPDILAISAEWNRVAIAKDFFHLVQTGKLTLEKAEADIRMTEAQRDQLLNCCGEDEARKIQAVYLAREQTWEAFLLLCAGESVQEVA